MNIKYTDLLKIANWARLQLLESRERNAYDEGVCCLLIWGCFAVYYEYEAQGEHQERQLRKFARWLEARWVTYRPAHIESGKAYWWDSYPPSDERLFLLERFIDDLRKMSMYEPDTVVYRLETEFFTVE